MTTNTLVLYAMWGTLSATVGAWVVALAKLIWQANEQAKADVKVCGSDPGAACQRQQLTLQQRPGCPLPFGHSAAAASYRISTQVSQRCLPLSNVHVDMGKSSQDCNVSLVWYRLPCRTSRGCCCMALTLPAASS